MESLSTIRGRVRRLQEKLDAAEQTIKLLAAAIKKDADWHYRIESSPNGPHKRQALRSYKLIGHVPKPHAYDRSEAMTAKTPTNALRDDWRIG